MTVFQTPVQYRQCCSKHRYSRLVNIDSCSFASFFNHCLSYAGCNHFSVQIYKVVTWCYRHTAFSSSAQQPVDTDLLHGKYIHSAVARSDKTPRHPKSILLLQNITNCTLISTEARVALYGYTPHAILQYPRCKGRNT